ncbi:dynein axonemal assembly factor 8 isoform X2 [Chiloscyllium plagiosum]|uniref:dynein axonemal assembly factor 8 isoform X2 n=1 Tax=Chiloscyllium plagiosum TaxID=36176 RepID=UPI001CB81D57|nr:dynein axonemal assembly factor 8 isoform X2 [Chiloscyllium plagiosum]
MSSNNNHKPAEIDEGNNELQRTYDSTMVGRDGLKSYWDRIFAHVKDELPSIDSDLSSSGSEDGEVAIFQRGTMGLISHVPDDLGDLSLDDPVLEEMLESARWPREAWAQDYKGRASEQDFQGENSRHLEKSTTTNKCNNIENIMLGQPATPITGESENSLGLEAESRPSKNKYLADLRNSGGGEPQSSIIPKAIDNKEREILRCQGSGDRNLDYRCISTKATGGLSELTTENDLMQNISQKTPELVLNKTIVTERHLVNSSQDQETTQIPKEGLKRRKSTRTVRHGHRPPILSLECVEQIDLDGLLKTLQQVGKSSSDFEDIMNGMWPASVPSHIKNEQNLMEQLTSLSIKQSGGVISLNNQTPICNGEHQSNSATQNKLDGDRANNLKQFLSPEANTRTKWMGEKLTMKRASEPKTIFIDLRNWQQERSTLQTDGKGNKEKLTYLQIERSLESSFEEDNQNSLSAQDSDQEQKEPESDSDYNDCTGKSMLLKKLRKASVNFSKVTANNSKSAAEQARATGEQIKPAQKKRRKAKNESNKPVGEQHGLTVAAESKTEIRALEELNSPNDQPALTPGLTLKKTTSKVTIPAVRQSELTLPPGEQYPETLSRLQPNDQMQREYCRKEQQRRQRLHRQLDSMKPLKSVTGMQCGADETPLLFHPEASYLPNISTLLQKGRSDMLLLTVQLSSCGQLTTSGQQAGHLLDSMMTTVNLYNALVSWFLSLVPTQLLAVNRLHGDCGDIEVKAPFQVLGVQQAWQEDGLALYVCVVPVSQVLNASKITYSKSRKNKPKEELRGTSIFYQLVMKFLSQTCLKAVIWWSKQMNDSLQRQMFPPEIYLPTVRLNSLISVKPDFKAVKKIFEIEMGFYWQTIETDESSCPSVTDIDESCGEKPEVTMALLFENLLINPVALHHTLQLILGNGLDICGLRLLYPSYRLLAESAGKLPSVYTPDDADPRPVLALALRGMNAGSLWMDIVGPTDPQLASVTDQHSINALYCKHRDEPLLYTPHQKIRIYWELCVWFGGRVPENGIVRVGIQNPGTKNSLKYRSNSLQSTGIHIDPRETCRPPTTLVATIRADIFLLVSPAVPPRCYGDIISVCTRRGFSLRGIRRLRLSPKRAGSLGIASVQIPVFCQTALTPHDSSDGPPTSELLCPCFLLLLRKENASHHVVNLLKGLANELAEQGLLGRIRNRLPPDTEVQTELCFHVAPYNEQTLQCLGGPLSAVHRSASLTPEVLYKHSFVSNPELEQVVVLTLTGPTAMKNAGNCLRDLLRPPSNNSNNSSGEALIDGGFELLGLKWLPKLSRNQAKELTPFEVGDRHWQASTDCLVSSPALVCVLRRVDAFKALAAVLTTPKARASLFKEKYGNLEKIMSLTPELAFRQAALFFADRELMSDPEARPLLKYLSPSLRSGITKPDKETQTINTESIFSYMLLGVQPLLTVLVIKSSTWPQHFLKILRKLDREHFCVVGMKLVSLDTEKASLLTPLSIQQDPGLVKCSIDSLTSGASVVLCLRRDNAVKKLLDLLGPEDPQQARDLDQFLWRGHYGTDRVHNGLYGSSSFITAIRDVKIFFPEGLCCEESQMMQDQQIACNTKDWRINPEFPKKRKLVRSLALTHLDSGTPTWQQQQQDLLLPRPLCQTMCLLLPSPLIRRCHHPPYIEVLDQLQSCNYQLMGARMSVLDQTQAQHVAELITVDNTSTICSLLTSGPCLMLALERDNGVCCFSTILTSLSWEKLELEDCLQYFVYPKSEPQVEQLISCLFDSLVPQSIHQIVLQDS